MRLTISVPSSRKGTRRKLSTVTSIRRRTPNWPICWSAELPVCADAVNQMRQLQILLHCKSIVANVRICASTAQSHRSLNSSWEGNFVSAKSSRGSITMSTWPVFSTWATSLISAGYEL